MPAESNPQTPSKRPDFQVFLIKSALRRELARACEREGLTLHLAEKSLCTDNAAMIGILAERKLSHQIPASALDEEIKPGWVLE